MRGCSLIIGGVSGVGGGVRLGGPDRGVVGGAFSSVRGRPAVVRFGRAPRGGMGAWPAGSADRSGHARSREGAQPPSGAAPLAAVAGRRPAQCAHGKQQPGEDQADLGVAAGVGKTSAAATAATGRRGAVGWSTRLVSAATPTSADGVGPPGHSGRVNRSVKFRHRSGVVGYGDLDPVGAVAVVDAERHRPVRLHPAELGRARGRCSRARRPARCARPRSPGTARSGRPGCR